MFLRPTIRSREENWSYQRLCAIQENRLKGWIWNGAEPGRGGAGTPVKLKLLACRQKLANTEASGLNEAEVATGAN